MLVLLKQHSTGAYGNDDQAIGKSAAGNSTKIHMACDGYGLPIDFTITGGEVHESKIAPAFVENLPNANYVIADKGYNNEPLRELIRLNYMDIEYLKK